MNTGIPSDILRSDLLQLALGVLVLASGLAACLLFIPRMKKRDYTLLFFGLAASMYGARLLATAGTSRALFPSAANYMRALDIIITGFIPVPLGLFFAEIIVPRWRKWVLWMAAVEFVEGIFYVTTRLLGRLGNVAERTNAAMVMLTFPALLLLFFAIKRPAREAWILRLGFFVFAVFVVYNNLFTLRGVFPRQSIEYIGFAFLLCCLGYASAAQALHKEEKLTAINKELEIARQIQSGLLPDQNAAVAGLRIATKYVPVSSVAGDFYDFLQTDGSGLGVLIADVTGHGVPAALSASMVKIAIRSQGERAQKPAEVLAGLNSVLCGNMQGQFVTAGYVYLDVARRSLSYAGAGHPPLLVWRARDKKVISIEENGLFLGAFPGSAYTDTAAPFEPGDRCLLYTDGILEAPDPQGEEFGAERLAVFLAENHQLPPREFCDELLAAIAKWCARPATAEQHDDLTLVAVDYAV